jgi:Protein of unknown function (DUF2946)
MPLHAHHRRITAWALVVLMLLAVLLPTVSRAHAAQQNPLAWLEVCTAQGLQKMPVDGPDKPAKAHVLDHCPLCVLSLDRIVPPGDVLVWQGLALTQAAPQSTHFPQIETARLWATHSRAPPVPF